MDKERIKFLDSAKGLAICLMVFAHAIAWNLADYPSVISINSTQSDKNLVAGLLWQFIYSFHMPLFFLISGYLTSEPIKEQYFNKIFRRSKQLLIPYIASGFIMLFIRGYFGYWFLLSLWQLSICGYLIHYINSIFNKNKKIYIDLIIIFIFFVLAKIVFKEEYKLCDVDISKFLIYFPSFIFGMLIRKYSNIAEFLFQAKNLSWYYIIFAIFFSFKYFDFKFDETILISIIQKIRNYILPISGSLAVIVYLKNRVNSIKLLEQLGVKSLSIYIFHIMFVIQIPSIGEWIISQSPTTCITLQVIYHSILAIIAIVLSLVCENIISYARPIKSILLGSK